MGVLKFHLTSPALASRFPELRRAYVTGLDRTPSRLGVALRPVLMTAPGASNESGRLFLPVPYEGLGALRVCRRTLRRVGIIVDPRAIDDLSRTTRRR